MTDEPLRLFLFLLSLEAGGPLALFSLVEGDKLAGPQVVDGGGAVLRFEFLLSLNRLFRSLPRLNQSGLLTMPRSPTSSEDEMAQSFSDYSDDCASDSSREETIYETIKATTEPPQSRMDDIHINSLVVRVLIPDLQQTVNTGSDEDAFMSFCWSNTTSIIGCTA